MRWYAGADHAGFELKNALVAALREQGDEVEDFGTQSGESVDYPDYAEKVARAVAADHESRGLLVCGTGIGMSIAANKVPGVRAALVNGAFTAAATRAHNDANVVCMGARVIGLGVALSALSAFRDTEFEAGRHGRRITKIDRLERA